jgi:hypothetical protein
LAAVVIAACLASCTGASETNPQPRPRQEVRDASDVPVHTLPRRPRSAQTALPVSFPNDDARLPNLLDDPPGRASLAYHPRESFDDRGGWSSESVFFLGTDGRWRALDMADLDLPESTWPGPDTYGAGQLSRDGRWWAARTGAGVLLLDLRSARLHVVQLPGSYTADLSWHPRSRKIDVVRRPDTPDYTTFTVTTRGSYSRAPYHLPADGIGWNGAVVMFERDREGVVSRLIRHGTRTERAEVALPFRLVRWGGSVGPDLTAFVHRGVTAVSNESMEPVARLRTDPGVEVGQPRGWIDPETYLFTDHSRGLLTWQPSSGQVRRLITPSLSRERNAWWTASVAFDLARGAHPR